MLRVSGEIQRTAPAHEGGGEEAGISRRVLLGSSAAAIAVAAFAGSRLVRGGGEDTAEQNQGAIEATKVAEAEATATAENDPYDLIVSKEEAIYNIDHYYNTVPDFYTERPLENPERLVGKTKQGLQEVATPHIESSILTDEDIEEVGHILGSIANAGGTPVDFMAAREVPGGRHLVGERDAKNRLLGNYPEYVEKQFVRPMIEALFPKNSAEVHKDLAEYFAQYAEGYEKALTDDRWPPYATVLVEATLIHTEVGRATIGLTIGRPVREGDWRDPEDAPKVHKSELGVSVTKNIDGEYVLGVLPGYHIGPVEGSS